MFLEDAAILAQSIYFTLFPQGQEGPLQVLEAVVAEHCDGRIEAAPLPTQAGKWEEHK